MTPAGEKHGAVGVLSADEELQQAVCAALIEATELDSRRIGVRTQTVSQSKEVTILADKTIPFSIVKQVMSTCTAQGYERISLAVVQKESPSQAATATTQI